jgi:dTDP-4-dehydrorhamnose reductase
MKLRIALTGSTGQVGRDLVPFLSELGELAIVTHSDCDLTDAVMIRRVLRDVRPNLLINAAAYTAVDNAEQERELAYLVNSAAVGVMAEEMRALGGAMVHYSTDYVFDGRKKIAYLEDDEPHPLNIYGESKLAGERILKACGVPFLLFRTSWVYATHGRNFMLTILRAATVKEELRIVNDQFGAPTWSRMIAAATFAALAKIYREPGNGSQFATLQGVYHLSAAGKTSWYEFARTILRLCHDSKVPGEWFRRTTNCKPFCLRRVIPVATEDFPRPARRPQNSVLSNSKIQRVFGIHMLDWEAQLRLAIQDCSAENVMPAGQQVDSLLHLS